MKNAISFLVFNFFLLILYIYIQKVNVSSSIISDNVNYREGASNFNHTLILDKGFIDIKGKTLRKEDHTLNVTDPDGIYKADKIEVAFSGKIGVFRENKDFILKRDAKVIFEDKRLTSDELTYIFSENKIISKPKTTININDTKIEGYNFEYDLEKKVLKANRIKGTI